MNEQWKWIIGFEQRYAISDLGRVCSFCSKQLKILSPSKVGVGGYYSVVLSCNGKRFTKRIHVLVLEAFIGPRPEGFDCCHGKGGKQDNRLENLRWDTHRNNLCN